MKKTIKWYQLLRSILPIFFGIALVTGLLSKNITMVFILFGLSLISGSFFCGWFCPFGFYQEILGKLGRLLKLPLFKIPAKIERYLRFSRYLLLILSFAGLGFVFFLSSPYGTFMGGISGNIAYLTITSWIFLGLTSLVSMIIDRPFCRYLCTEGAQYGALSMARFFSIKRNTESCISCGACDKACPSQIKISTKNHVRNGQCTNCFSCIDACPVKNTLSFGWVLKKGDKS